MPETTRKRISKDNVNVRFLELGRLLPEPLNLNISYSKLGAVVLLHHGSITNQIRAQIIDMGVELLKAHGVAKKSDEIEAAVNGVQTRNATFHSRTNAYFELSPYPYGDRDFWNMYTDGNGGWSLSNIFPETRFILKDLT